MTALLDHLFARLPGVWSVARIIEDGRFGAGRFDGLAEFAPRGDGALLCSEAGELAIGAWRGPAYREWLYVRHAHSLNIFYPDGQTLLHCFDFEAGVRRAEHTHLCGEDRYHAAFELADEAAFTIDYAVDGPAKRYGLHTVYAATTAQRERAGSLRI